VLGVHSFMSITKQGMSEGPAEGLRGDIDLEAGIITFWIDSVKK